MRAIPVERGSAWPELPWRDWQPTISTLHMWTQIVGKVRMALTPPLNHWWHVPLYVSARGLTTGAIPFEGAAFQVDFDLVDHRLVVTDHRPGSFAIGLEGRSVAGLYRELMSGLRSRGIAVTIMARPVEVAESIPFEQDERHAGYDPNHAEQLWRCLVHADRVLRRFRGSFVGKSSPVHVFWGGFDLASSRFSGRPAPPHAGGVPNCPDWVMHEAYSHEVWSAGWWPRSQDPGPAFYAYIYPEPEGFRDASIPVNGASYDTRLGEFVLPYDTVRTAADPDAMLLAFLESTYGAAADLGGWDRASLETARSGSLTRV
jgi:hypothetical protein